MTRLSHELPATMRRKSAATAPRRQPEARPGSFYRVVWRWHFYAGMIVAPVLIVAAATGALYIFKDEIERVLYARAMYVAPQSERCSYDEQLATAVASVSDGATPTNMYVFDESEHATGVFVRRKGNSRTVWVDPYRGTVLGAVGKDGFFGIVLKIHRTLFAGTPGRIVIELMTCWTIVLLLTGLYLWWPRTSGQRWGVWLPRLRGGRYRALRDLHAVTGLYVCVVALTIACTGLLYTYFWGRGYGAVAVSTGAYSVFTNPPQSTSPPNAPPLPLDNIVGIARRAMPDADLSITLPREPRGAYLIFASRDIGPTNDEYVVLDRATGEVLAHKQNREYPALGWWATWNYPLHVGSVLGMTTKVLWAIACCGLMVMPVTGVWMWWQRRPRGTAGVPRRVEARVPRWLVGVICTLGLVLPALGASLLLILLGEGAVRWARRAP